MGLYRTLTAADLQPGDVFVWDYALNDQHHIDMKGNDPETLLRHCETALRHAGKAGARPLGIGLAPLGHALGGRPATAYAREVEGLFAALGVPLYRLWCDVAARTGVALTEGDFSDPLHLRPGGRVVCDVAEWLVAEIGGPGAVWRGGAGPRGGDCVHVVEAFEGGERGRFANRLIDVDVWTVPEAPGALRWTGGMGEPVEVHGLVVLAEAGSGVLRIGIGAEEALLSTAPRITNGVETLFRFISLQAATGRRFHLMPGETITMGWLGGRPRAAAFDVGFMPRAKPGGAAARATRIAAILVESGAG